MAKWGRSRMAASGSPSTSGAQIIPIAVCGTRTLPKHSWKFGFTRALVAVGTPIPTTGRDASDLEAIKAEARAQIEALRARMLPLTSAEGFRNEADVERHALKVSTGV